MSGIHDRRSRFPAHRYHRRITERYSARSLRLGLFARLAHPVDFDSIDERPVDVVFLLVAPEGAGADHLKALARVSRLLRDRSLVEKLRATESADALYALLVDSVQAQSAA